MKQGLPGCSSTCCFLVLCGRTWKSFCIFGRWRAGNKSQYLVQTKNKNKYHSNFTCLSFCPHVFAPCKTFVCWQKSYRKSSCWYKRESLGKATFIIYIGNMIMVYFDKNINLWHQETYKSLDLCMFQSLAEPEPLRLCLHRPMSTWWGFYSEISKWREGALVFAVRRC